MGEWAQRHFIGSLLPVQARASGLDWRDAAAYALLLDADRSLFAWEWLRRDARYIEAAAEEGLGTGRSAAAFGLVDFEPPQLSVPPRPAALDLGCPSLCPARDPRRGRAGAGDAFELGRFGAIATLIERRGTEHLLLCDGLRTVRLDAPAGTFGNGAVCLRYKLEGIGAAERSLLTLRRLLALCRSGGFSRSLHPREACARRWILMLRACDGPAAGADQREIAEERFSRIAREPRWRSREPSVRSLTQRLVRSARAFSMGGYRGLLG